MKIVVDMWVRTELIVESEPGDGVAAYRKACHYLHNPDNYITQNDVQVDRALAHGAIRVYETQTGKSLYDYWRNEHGHYQVTLHGKKESEKTNRID